MTTIQAQINQELEQLPPGYGDYILEIVRGLRIRLVPPKSAVKNSEMDAAEFERAVQAEMEKFERETAGMKPSERFCGCLNISDEAANAWLEEIQWSRQDQTLSEGQITA